MNRLQFWNINKLAASFVCAAGMLASSSALAGGDGYWLKLDDVDARRDYDGDIRVWGELDGYTYNDRIEVQVRALVRVEDLCINHYGRVDRDRSYVRYLTVWDYERLGSIHYDRDFHINVDVDRRLGYRSYCGGGSWRSIRKVRVEHAHLRLMSGYGYGYGYDRDYDCHFQRYDCGSGYRGCNGIDYGYGYGYGYGYDAGWYGYDNHEYGWGYGYGYDYGYSWGSGRRYGDYGYGKGFAPYDYRYYDYGDDGYYDHDHGYVIATAECWFSPYSRNAYCNDY